MTLLIWDTSHYDGLLSPAILARAKAEGIVALTHKLAEGMTDTEGTSDDAALSTARAIGIEFLGAYLVPRDTASVSAQVDYWLQVADASEPWWRDYPGWFWQVDLERWPYDNVPASVGVEAAKELRDRTGRWTILYASHSMYGDQLASWDGPLWNADYVSGSGSPGALYPGDNWQPLHGSWRGGWAPYSGQEPTFLQYSSSATIAGLTTRDVSAYRGTIDELRQLIQGGTMDPNAYAAERYLYKQHIMDPEIDGIPDAGGQTIHSEFIDTIRQIAIDAAKAASAAGGVTQDQVDAAVAKALADPASPLGQLAASVAALGPKLDKVLSALAAAGREAAA